MKELKDAALKRPEDFYEFGVLGEPAVVFPFVMALHTLKEDFKEDLLDLSGAELFDWWDVLCELKRGLRISAEQKSQEGQPVLERLKEIYECGDFVISSLEQGVECEFQWLLCQQYTVRNMRLKEAWKIWNKMQISRPVSNEYSGENVLHILIVQGGGTNLHISKLFELVTLQRYKMSLLCAEVSAEKCLICIRRVRHHIHQVSSRFFCPVYGGGIVNFGRTPVHFAVCTGQAAVVQLLLRQCLDSKQRYFHLWTRDSMGNTVLHMCVLNNLQMMYDILMGCMEDLERELRHLEWWHIKTRLSLEDDDNLKNFDGYTVCSSAQFDGCLSTLTLATARGNCCRARQQAFYSSHHRERQEAKMVIWRCITEHVSFEGF